ncbi:MAG: flagellar hook-length control protein FliK [Bacteroidetes bacterium]|nr:flagellar hook-length control protein FliK [Bacteroidota bacterium]
MKFNTLIIDKLNNFDSVSKQNTKKSSLAQFADIINVCSPESLDSAQNPSSDSLNATDTTLNKSELTIQVSAKELNDILLFTSAFVNAENAQPTETNAALSSTEQNKKELVLSKDQLQAFFNFVLAPLNNQFDGLAQIEKIDQAKAPVTLTFDDGTNKLSITVSALSGDNTGEENLQGAAKLSRFFDSNAISSNPLSTAASVQSFSNKSDSNSAEVVSEKNKTLSVDGSVKINNDGKANASFKVEISQQTNSAGDVAKVIELPVELDSAGIFTGSQPKILVKEAPVIVSGEKYLADMNGLGLSTAINISKVVADKNSLDLNTVDNSPKAAAGSNVGGASQEQKAIPIEQILFGYNPADDISAESVLPENVLQGLSNEEKSTLLKSFSYGDVLSIEYSHQAAKPLEVTPKIANAASVLSNNASEVSQTSIEPQISKQALIFNLPDTQNQLGDKSVHEAVRQLNDLAASVAASKELNEKTLAKVSLKPNSQVDDPATLDKESAIKVSIKEEKQTSKNLNETKANDLNDTKTDKQPVRDAQLNQQDDKDTTKHNSNDVFKNSVLPNTASAGAEKTQFVSELKTLPSAARTITTNEIIPEFSKVIQQGEKQTITFQLSPENLGKVKLTVDLVANNLNAHIEVENDQVKHFIQSNIDQLKQNFQSNGIQLNNVNVSLTEYDQRNAKTFVPKKKFSSRDLKNGIVDKAASPVSRKSMGYNTYEFLA